MCGTGSRRGRIATVAVARLSLTYPQVAVLEMMLKAVRDSGSGDKVVLVSNYTEALDVLEAVRAGMSPT